MACAQHVSDACAQHVLEACLPMTGSTGVFTGQTVSNTAIEVHKFGVFPGFGEEAVPCPKKGADCSAKERCRLLQK